MTATALAAPPTTRSPPTPSISNAQSVASTPSTFVRNHSRVELACEIRELTETDRCFGEQPISDYDAILPRIGASITYFGTALVRQFEQMDVYTPNTANGIANSPTSVEIDSV